MQVHLACFLAVFAGGVSTASAQSVGTILKESPDGSLIAVPVHTQVVTGLSPADSSAGGYAGRSTTVFDSSSGLLSNPTRVVVASSHILDDFTFAPGPWASAAHRVPSAWDFWMWFGDWSGDHSPPIEMRVTFYNASAFAKLNGASMIPADATAAGNLVYSFPTGWFDPYRPGGGTITVLLFTANPLDTTPGSEDVLFAGGEFLIEASIESSAGPVTNFGFVMLSKSGGLGHSPDAGYGRDADLDGTFLYPNEYRTNGRSFPMTIYGDVCPCRADFDNSGGTPDVSDIDAYFAAWLGAVPEADANCSGGSPDAADIADFFDQWLAGGC